MAETAEKRAARPAQEVVVQSGNEIAATAAKHVNYHIMGYYPITPSTEVAESLDAMKAEQEQAKQKKAQQKAAAEKRRRNCNDARDTLRNITEAGRLYRLDEQGKRVILSDQERTRATDDARARGAKWCN